MRIKSWVAASVAATALVAAGVTTHASQPPTASSGDGAVGTAALTIAKPDGPITTESNNPWVNDASGMRLGYINAILEPLGIVNLIDPTAATQPWLASEITWSDDFTSVDLVARDGVSWSDGEPFTADDIAFTFNLFIDRKSVV